MMFRGQTIGAYHLDTINKVGDVSKMDQNHLIQRACARGLEEFVELCLTAGMSTGDIFQAVTDAFHNEGLKAQQYPSRFERRNVDFTNMIVEVVDVRICLDYIRHLSGVSKGQIDVHTSTKLELLRMRA